MEEFDQLIAVADRLMGEGGCPWDRKQTFDSLKPYVTEEGAELIEAVEEGTDSDIIEELADLLYVVIFYCKVAEKENRFTLQDLLSAERDKLIRRHPHVFGDIELKDMDHLHAIWEGVKSEEKKERKTVFDGIPKTLPPLARTQKMLGRMIKKGMLEKLSSDLSEEKLGEALFALVHEAESAGLQADAALRRRAMRCQS